MATLQRVLTFVYTFILLVDAQSGTYFVYENSVYPSYSSWIITYSVHLEPFESRLRLFLDEINELSVAFKQLKERDEPKNNYTTFVHSELFKLIEQEKNQFLEEYETISGMFKDTKTLGTITSTRQKRSILPIVGELLSGLFGTVSERDFQDLQSMFQDLKDNQQQVIDVVSNSLTLLNKTNVEVQRNREMLNALLSATNKLHHELKYVYHEIAMKLWPEIVFTSLVTRLQTIFHIVSSTMREIHFTFVTLKRQLEYSIHGHLDTALIRPNELKTILNDIRNALPPGISLPYTLDQIGLLKYYRFLHPTVIPETQAFHIIIGLPLRHDENEYSVFRAIQVPVPDKKSGLGAKYSLESNYLAIANNKKHYAFLDYDEISICASVPICKFTSPLLSVYDYPTCVLSLYLRNAHRIQELCMKDYKVFPRVPIVKHMFGRHWLISTVKPISVTINCKASTQTLSITDVYVLSLENGCSASSPSFEIPMLIQGSSTAEQEIKLAAEVEISKLAPNIWSDSEHVKSTFGNYNLSLDASLVNLPAVQDLPLTHLYHVLDKAVQRSRDESVRVVWKERVVSISLSVAILIGLAIAAVAIFVVYFKCKKRAKSYAENVVVKYVKGGDSVVMESPKSDSNENELVIAAV